MKIYIITHKKFEPKLEIPSKDYQVLLVGAASNKQNLNTYLRDDQGENISLKNKNFCELTGIYWIWKNSEEKIVGVDHYRRYFVKDLKEKRLLTEDDVKKYLKNNDIILPQKDPFIFRGKTAAQYFGDCHDPLIWTLCRNIIEKKYPNYLADFDWFSYQKTAYCYNMFISSADLINEYNEWLFDILFSLESQIDIKKYDSYNQRMYGFVSERLINVWVHHKNLKVKEVPVYFTEHIPVHTKLKNMIKLKILKAKLQRK